MFSTVINNSKTSNIEKLFYITQNTKGEDRDIVSKCPLTHQGFELAWKDLFSRYENRRVLVNGQLKLLFNLQSVSTENSKALKQIQRDINSCISILKLYNIDVASWDPIFVYICTNCLPETTLTLWEQSLEYKTVIPQWSHRNDFLTRIYRTLESVSEFRSSNSTKNDSRPKNNDELLPFSCGKKG